MRGRSRCICTLAALFAWLLGLAGAVSAQPRTFSPDFTFVVPVQLTSLHQNIRSATVWCVVYASGQIAQNSYSGVAIEQEGRPGNSSFDVIGRGQAQGVQVVNRQLNATFTVPVTADLGKDPGKARLYLCGIYLYGDPDEHGSRAAGARLLQTNQTMELQWAADPNQPHQVAVAGTIAPPAKALEYKGPAAQPAKPQQAPGIKR